ncbi:unnamed protein product [Peronospora farinosa]|uniref:CCHC-type domain-containing protein n=1 Tax=Peronospora farinosa TaxID=134698 RepID=A0AAV0UAG4_9STRA|nr:unnamed protein product [Peronospora farinosa]
MERMYKAFRTTVTAPQSINLFRPSRTTIGRVLNMATVGDACGGGAEARVLDNIVHYASADLSMVLMAKFDAGRIDYLRQAEELAHFSQAVEVDSCAGKSLGREVVANDSTQRKETRTCHNCKKQGHLRKD